MKLVQHSSEQILSPKNKRKQNKTLRSLLTSDVTLEEFEAERNKLDLLNAPINVNPEGGGGRAKGGDLINQVVPWVGIWTDTFFLSGPRVGIFDRLTLISDDILKKPEPIFEQTEYWSLVHRSPSRALFLQ